MKILIYGAGVIGSLYATRLYENRANIEKILPQLQTDQIDQGTSSFQITLLARGARYSSIKKEGVVIEHYLQQRRTREYVPVIEKVSPSDYFDFIIVIMRKNQIKEILPKLNQNISPNIVFMGNNGTCIEDFKDEIDPKRILLGFPSAGGQREGQLIKSIYREDSPLTIGEISGETTRRIKTLKTILETAGIQVKIAENIDAWLKYHIALVSPLANGIYLAKGDNFALAKNKHAMKLMITAIKEGFRVLQDLGHPITPNYLKKLYHMPRFVLRMMLKKLMGSENGKLAMRDHAMAAPDEMLQIANEFKKIKQESSIPTPSIDTLFEYLPNN
ncbi:ketopantoate reductase family protein [Candidatus Lokiarchaeum ossiferum]|uniref:ketopantoate reductase family protein n=1 Tax=Candidatus Lokiarchaeum ossiferum TaxID=2951803 RepID=UPI00352D6F19